MHTILLAMVWCIIILFCKCKSMYTIWYQNHEGQKHIYITVFFSKHCPSHYALSSCLQSRNSWMYLNVLKPLLRQRGHRFCSASAWWHCTTPLDLRGGTPWSSGVANAARGPCSQWPVGNMSHLNSGSNTPQFREKQVQPRQNMLEHTIRFSYSTLSTLWYMQYRKLFFAICRPIQCLWSPCSQLIACSHSPSTVYQSCAQTCINSAFLLKVKCLIRYHVTVLLVSRVTVNSVEPCKIM